MSKGMHEPWCDRQLIHKHLIQINRAHTPALSQTQPEESDHDLTKRAGGFRQGVSKFCNLCGKDEPTEEIELPSRPLQRVEPEPPGSPLYELWKTIPDGQKAKTGEFKATSLDMSTPARWGATQIYGCTVVIIVDGRGLFIGHYPQIDSMGQITMDNDLTAQLEIADPLQKGLSKSILSIDLTTEAKVWVVHNVPRNLPSFAVNGYTQDRPGWQTIVQTLKEEFGVQERNIRSQPYQSTSPESRDNLGKVVVDWRPMNDGATLDIYFNSGTPVKYQYDAEGNNCRPHKDNQNGAIIHNRSFRLDRQ